MYFDLLFRKTHISKIQHFAIAPAECGLNQVFMNILNNAMDALLEQSEEVNKQIIIKTEVINRNGVESAQIIIQDNARGIPL
ncbi:hypothetical protein RintRC_1667 [Richelia intracellularis]|nr:hypothetical protein RintRC_3766 [Richelia intracellularis]CDN12373.1 hypothetical protein RintRC_1667 [Richelia intracellularis]